VFQDQLFDLRDLAHERERGSLKKVPLGDLVQEALDNLMKGRTSFVIAHRLSTIRNADKIVLIDKGIVSESGTHSELMSHNGLYRKLNDMQFDFGMVTQSPATQLTAPSEDQEYLETKE